ncbi:MAG: metalloprotease TldD [Gammaproteobacteria bacterium]|nr:metalloprotease TldD [Gammaproteobacteria bacterium]
MSTALDTARRILLDPGALDEPALERVLGDVTSHAVDAADLYFERTVTESWVLEDGLVKEAGHSIDQGVGVRVTCGEKTGFAYADEIEPAALAAAGAAVRAIARQGRTLEVAAWSAGTPGPRYADSDPVASLDDRGKVALLTAVDAEARRCDPGVKQVIVSLSGRRSVVLVAAADGTLAADVRPLVRLNVTVVAERNGRRESATCGGGGRFGYEWFAVEARALGFAREAVRQALVNLDATPAPAGSMTVVLAPGWPGVLLHEAIGHGLEGDFIRKGTSAFAGRLGERVAAPGVTVVDDGTLPDRRGSLNVDDEGTPAGRTVLIEDGILRAYLQDRHNARLMGSRATGNGRRQSYAHRPLPRMTNTFMLAGPYAPEEIVAGVDRGLYAVNFGGGQVDITSGKFVFSASEAYLIEHGRVTRPVKGATLIGHGPDVLTRVSMVGNDLALDPGVGTCGKDGQQVPVGVGLPTLRIDAITVGGTGSGA